MKKSFRIFFAIMLVSIIAFTVAACSPIKTGDEADTSQNAATLTGISVSGYTAEFEKGTEFSTGNITVTATFSDESTKTIVIADCTVDSSAYNKDAAGQYTIKISYGEIETTYTVSVVDNTVTYTLTVVGGTGSGTYASGTSVTATATVPSGKRFVNWTEGGVEQSTDATYSFNLTADTTVTANFEDAYTQGLSFTLNSAGTEYSVAKGTATDNNVIIPNTYNNKPVTAISSSGFENCVSLQSITIPDSVTNIGSQAFCDCTGLTSVTIGKGVTSIGYNAFSRCWGLTGITIPNSVTNIGHWAFYGCEGLTSITIPDSVTNIDFWAFCGCTGLTSITIPDSVTNIGDSAFEGTAWYNNQPDGLVYAGKVAYCYKGTMPANTYITLKSDTKGIAAFAFNGCTGLTSITIGNSVESIGEDAFYNCTGLTSITIGNSVESIGSEAFSGCTGLTSVTIPDSVTNIDNLAFLYCYKLIEVYNKSSLTIAAGNNANGYVGEYAKNVYTEEGGSKLTTDANGYVIYTDGAEKILVAYTGTETDLTLPSGITEIYQYAFSGCRELKSVIIPDSVTSIGQSAFSGCKGLASITIPDGVTSIGFYTFAGCRGLTSVTIPDSVTSIVTAFNDCYKLIEVYNKSSLAITAGSSKNGYVGYYAKNVYTEEGGSKLTTDEYGYIIYTDGAEKILVAYTGTATDLTLPSGITKIYQRAFYGCTGLTSVTIPDGVTIIGNYAFYGCTGLTSVTIPDGVKSIGEYAFFGCTGLTSVTIPDGVKSIGNNAFFGCTGLTSVTIGNSVTSVGSGAFWDCTGLTSVTIGNSVTSVGSGAFWDCTGLTSITIPDSVTSIGEYAFSDTAWYNNQPDGLVYAGKVAYNYKGTMPANTSIILKSDTKGIADYAFDGCTGLTSITIPDSVTSIGSYAFDGCGKLIEVYNKSSLTITAGSSENGRVGYYAKNVYTEEGGSKLSTDANGYEIYTDGTEKILVAYTGTETDLMLPNGITEIYQYAFSGCRELKSVTIPDSVNSIGARAFYGCTGLTSVTIPDSVTSIGSYAFSNCTGLTSITIGNSVESIGGYAFYNCTGLTSIKCRAASKPSGWHSDWKNGCNATVTWGYTGV